MREIYIIINEDEVNFVIDGDYFMLYNSYIKQNECLVFIEMKGMI